MTGATVPGADPGAPPIGAHERRLAVGTLAQQAGNIVGVAVMLAVITALGRTLSLPEFGTYGLLVSLAGYLLVAQGSVEAAAVKAFAEALEQEARDRAFSTALFLYAVFGLAAGALIIGGGTAALGLFDIPRQLEDEARAGVLALGLVTAVGWPFKVFQDVLRGEHLFVAAATAEAVAYVALGAGMAALLLADAPLWGLIALGGAIPLLTGATSAVAFAWRRLPYRWRPAAMGAESVRGFLGLSGYLFVMGIADLVIYSLDRAILAAFRSAATVGLYEGPIRAHNLVRQLHGSLVIPVLPAAARYMEQGDLSRTRDLLLRGLRYVLAVTVPVTVVLMVLAGPILVAWLGPEFGAAGTAMTILVSYWLVGANTGVTATMLLAAGRARALTIYAWAVALLNLAMSLALTPVLGLEGVVLGTTIPYVLLAPVLIWLTLGEFPVRLGELARTAWLPAYSTGLALAAVLLGLRAAFGLDDAAAILAAGAGGVLAYWAAFYLVWLAPAERRLVRGLARAALGRGRAPAQPESVE